jgi:hypothetical protein
MNVRETLFAVALLLGGSAPAFAQNTAPNTATPYAAGCLKGAAVGGVAGYVAGHHGTLGGCRMRHWAS